MVRPRGSPGQKNPGPKPKFRNGQKVRLPGRPKSEDYPDGLVEEHGVVEGRDKMSWGWSFIVRVSKPLDKMDDCLREVSEDDMEAVG